MSFKKLRAHMDDYLPLAFAEAQALKLQPTDRLLFVGSGSLPMTAICFALLFECKFRGILGELEQLLKLHDQHNAALDFLEKLTESAVKVPASLTCLDLSESANENARRVLSDLGLHNQISILYGDGSSAHLSSPIDVLCIASMANPKIAIVKNILSQQANPVRVLLRTVPPQDLRALLYEPFTRADVALLIQQIPGLMHVASCVPAPGSMVINSFEQFEFYPNTTTNLAV